MAMFRSLIVFPGILVCLFFLKLRYEVVLLFCFFSKMTHPFWTGVSITNCTVSSTVYDKRDDFDV